MYNKFATRYLSMFIVYNFKLYKLALNFKMQLLKTSVYLL